MMPKMEYRVVNEPEGIEQIILRGAEHAFICGMDYGHGRIRLEEATDAMRGYVHNQTMPKINNRIRSGGICPKCHMEYIPLTETEKEELNKNVTSGNMSRLRGHRKV